MFQLMSIVIKNVMFGVHIYLVILWCPYFSCCVHIFPEPVLLVSISTDGVPIYVLSDVNVSNVLNV